MNKTLFLVSIILMLISCKTTQSTTQKLNNKAQTNKLLNQWHRDVAEFNYDAYFNKMTEDAVFVGTDASEVWSKQKFQTFCKPYFDKKQTWDFKPINRNVYIKDDGKTAWFDELLDTWMGICRGSGVLVRQNSNWKIQHYVLSVAIPNEDVKDVVAIKKKRDSLQVKKLKKK